jgi:heme A synthase
MSEQESTDASAQQSLRRFAWLSFITAFFTYCLIVFGGVVRITGSGMGCGDDWPLCNGRLIPPMDFMTAIEYGHRLAALFVSVLIIGLAVYAFRQRESPAFKTRRLFPYAIVAVVMLVVQVMVGAITVWMELPAGTVVLHLGLASLLLAVLIVAGLRALLPAETPPGGMKAGYQRWAHITAALVYVLLIFGGLVANTGAGPLCQGFPLCNGQWFPEGGGLVHLHWTHRVLAYALVPIALAAAIMTVRQKAPVAVSRAAMVALGLVIGQVWVAAEMVILHLPPLIRGLHLAVGVALWAALVVWASLARRLPYSAATGA